jgi:hypothetical protein
VAFRRFRAADVRSIQTCRHRPPRPTGNAQALDLPGRPDAVAGVKAFVPPSVSELAAVRSTGRRSTDCGARRAGKSMSPRLVKRPGVLSIPPFEADAPNLVWAIDFQFDHQAPLTQREPDDPRVT